MPLIAFSFQRMYSLLTIVRSLAVPLTSFGFQPLCVWALLFFLFVRDHLIRPIGWHHLTGKYPLARTHSIPSLWWD
nr:hypothetical protein Q903MT_gene457 [Picea sitchensis]